MWISSYERIEEETLDLPSLENSTLELRQTIQQPINITFEDESVSNILDFLESAASQGGEDELELFTYESADLARRRVPYISLRGLQVAHLLGPVLRVVNLGWRAGGDKIVIYDLTDDVSEDDSA